MTEPYTSTVTIALAVPEKIKIIYRNSHSTQRYDKDILTRDSLDIHLINQLVAQLLIYVRVFALNNFSTIEHIKDNHLFFCVHLSDNIKFLD